MGEVGVSYCVQVEIQIDCDAVGAGEEGSVEDRVRVEFSVWLLVSP